MNLVTMRAASKALGMSEGVLRRAVAKGQVESMAVGNRRLVDLDQVRHTFAAMAKLVGMEVVSQRTGLSISAIRRGIAEGWIPCQKPGRAYLFQLEAVAAAIQKRMASSQE